jgi:hypothetical protein
MGKLNRYSDSKQADHLKRQKSKIKNQKVETRTHKKNGVNSEKPYE